MNDGGTYIIEDLCCSYWAEFGGGVKSNNSAMYFFKLIKKEFLIGWINLHNK